MYAAGTSSPTSSPTSFVCAAGAVLVSPHSTSISPQHPNHPNLISPHAQFWSLPDVLVMQLKRFSAQGMWRRKNDTPVRFPLELDLAAHVMHPSARGGANGSTTNAYLYDLIACSNHYGSTGGGHYTAFAKNSLSGDWYKFDDSHTSLVEDVSSIITPAAYVLIYMRRGAQGGAQAACGIGGAGAGAGATPA